MAVYEKLHPPRPSECRDGSTDRTPTRRRPVGGRTPGGGRTASPTGPTPSTTSRSSRWPPSTWPGRVDVLDVGTGEGQVARVAAGAGRRGWSGVDPTWAQLDVAGAAGRRARLRCGPRRWRCPSRTESFDAVVACLVFEHIDDVDAAIAEVGRVLRPGGRFLFFLNHPLLQTPGSGWIDDHILEEQYWRIGPYLVEDISLEEVEKDVFLPFVHRPLSRYVNAMAAAGLVITRMEEPPPPARLPGAGRGVPRRRHHPPPALPPGREARCRLSPGSWSWVHSMARSYAVRPVHPSAGWEHRRHMEGSERVPHHHRVVAARGGRPRPTRSRTWAGSSSTTCRRRSIGKVAELVRRPRAATTETGRPWSWARGGVPRRAHCPALEQLRNEQRAPGAGPVPRGVRRGPRPPLREHPPPPSAVGERTGVLGGHRAGAGPARAGQVRGRRGGRHQRPQRPPAPRPPARPLRPRRRDAPCRRASCPSATSTACPLDVDLVFDCRFLPNPHWVDELRPLTGLDEPVRDYVLGQPETARVPRPSSTTCSACCCRPTSRRASRYLSIAVGCTGGTHRSVVHRRGAGHAARRSGASDPWSPTETSGK